MVTFPLLLLKVCFFFLNSTYQIRSYSEYWLEHGMRIVTTGKKRTLTSNGKCFGGKLDSFSKTWERGTMKQLDRILEYVKQGNVV